MNATVPSSSARREWNAWAELGARLLLTMLCATVTLFGCVAVAAARDMPGGIARERAAMHALAGTGWTFSTIAHVLSLIPECAAMVAVLVVAAFVVGGLRRQAIAAGALMIGANVSTQALKDALGSVLSPVAATVPSGHAVLALSSACAVVMIAPARWREAALVIGGALATLGCTGVLAAYWHVPGDVIGALLVVGGWVGIIATWSGALAEPRGRRSVSGRHVAMSLAGSAWTVVTFLGWGTSVNAFGIWWDVAAFGDLLVIPVGAASVVALAARGLPGPSDMTH